MSLSYAAHINGDKVYDIATGYWIEAKQEAAASTGRMQWSVYLYDDTGTFVEKYTGGSFSEADKDKYLFAGFDMNINVSNASWRIFAQVLPSYSIILSAGGTSTTLKQYFSGEQGYAINADYAVIDVQPLAVSDNGTYTAPFSKAYSPVTVDVQEQPWQPLQDGYSNFWVNIPADRKTLALNLYSKSESAVIDWGDGTGETTLDTLTPSHTYSDSGKYIIKLKGVTGIGQLSSIVGGIFTDVFEYIEFNNEVITAVSYAFRYLASLKDISCSASLLFGTGAFQYCGLLSAFTANYASIASNQFNQCFSLRNITLSRNVTSIGVTAFGLCVSLVTISIPDTVTTIDNYAFRYCTSLSEIHIAATVPPTLGADVFSGIVSDFIIYVPTGTGDTYKAAAGWSTYAGHILEEGQTPNRAMLSRLAKAADTDTDEDMR